ncbi:MAG: DUF2330 domain-containing protein [Nannocystaceae bacterium]|nr:DUF2330 domain-containing protein [bacterium]
MMKTTLASLAALTSALVLFTPQEADACGGTFCDAGPQQMPVDQTGENILFVMAGEYTEAHIQIQYDPTAQAEQFSWIVPLTDVPEFGVGSELLFDAVLNATVPRYGFNTVNNCNGTDPTGFGGSTGGGFDSSAGGSDTDGGDPGGGVDILLEEVVGAFEITVLSGGSLEDINNWLVENEYQVDPNADPILEEYLSEGYIFAAFKLTNDAETSEIHPITLRFPNDEACIPIRLTRIAAVDDMDIRSFFLSDNRVVPSTYKHVLVNPLKLDWANLAANYKSVITQAVDADEAGGRAFVTEYAGPSNIVPTFNLYNEQWNSTPFAKLAPIGVVDVLENQDLMTCFEDGGFGTSTGGSGGDACQYNHPLLRGLLQKWLPVPEGVDEVSFYGCLSCYQDQIDMDAWDSAGFAADFEARIVAPGARANEILEAFPHLTRMYTTMSPGEMTEDPFFYQNPDLPEVDLTSQIATQTQSCGAEVVWTLPDGREVYSPDSTFPDFPDEMPWEEEVAEMMQQGAPIVLINQTETINAQLSMHNCQYNYPSAEECGNPGGDTDGFPGGTDSDSAGESGGGTDSGSAGQDTQLDDDGGCNCSTSNEPGGPMALALGLFGLLGLRRRRG